MKPSRKHLSFRVEAPLHDDLRSAAFERGVSLNRLLEDLCESGLRAAPKPSSAAPTVVEAALPEVEPERGGFPHVDPEANGATRHYDPEVEKCPASSKLDHNFCTICRHIYRDDHWAAS